MTSVSRRPLVPVSRTLSLQIPTVLSPLKRTASSVSKRARSPDATAESNSKRVKRESLSPSTLAAREDDRKEKERKRAERDAQKQEFRIKYTKAFPGWVFYFNLDLLDPDSASVREYLESKVTQLGGVSPIVDFALYFIPIISSLTAGGRLFLERSHPRNYELPNTGWKSYIKQRKYLKTPFFPTQIWLFVCAENQLFTQEPYQTEDTVIIISPCFSDFR